MATSWDQLMRSPPSGAGNGVDLSKQLTPAELTQASALPRPRAPSSPQWDALSTAKPTTAPPPDDTGWLGALARRAGAAALPATGGFAAAELGTGLGAGAGALTGPAAPVAVPVLGLAGGLLGAFGGASAVKYVQDKALEASPWLRHALGQDPTQVQADEQAHPWASAAGEVAPMLLTMRPGSAPAAARLLGAGIGGGVEAGQEYVHDGHLDPVRIGLNAGVGAFLPARTALGERLAAPGDAIATRMGGANVRAHLPAAEPEPLVDAPLDTAPIPPDVAAALQGAGADPAQFSTPELAAAAAARATAAASRAPANFEGLPPEPRSKSGKAAFDAMLAALHGARADGSLPSRTVPDDVSIISAPEGAIRSDDAGGIAGVERARAANSAVLEEALRAAAADPVVSHILASNLPDQSKIRTVWDRIAPAADAPFQASTPDGAAAGVRRAANPSQSLIHDITMASESAGDPNAVSSKGAKGLMQVIDTTNRDPGYGVRPAADGSPAERARVGRDYIDALQRHYGGDMEKAWAAYNAGPGALDGAVAKHGADWFEHMPAETRAYVNKNMAALGGDRGPPSVLRMSAPDDPTGLYSGRTQPNPGKTNPGETTLGDAEDPGAATSPSMREMAAGVGAGEGPSGASGGSDRLFRSSAADAEWEARARATADELHAKAKEDLERQWQERAAQQGASERFEQQRASSEQAAAGDPSAMYRGKYDQKPTRAGDVWATTDEGYVAGATGKPVAFRNAREAAKWAAGEKLGGDFEFTSWGGQDRTGNQRVALRRRAGSDYGRAADGPQPAQGRPFDNATPPAGRSADTSQRALPAPVDEPAAPRQEAPIPSETARVDPGRADVAGGAAGVGEPARTGSNVPPPASAEGGAPRQARAARTRAPEDALTFLAKRGGIRDDEGHDLRGRGRLKSGAVTGPRRRAGGGGGDIPQLAPGGGHVFRKNGMALDRAGEALHEAGFSIPEGHTEADVVDFLHRAASPAREYRVADLDQVHDRRLAQANEDARAAAGQKVDEELAGFDLTPEEREATIDRMNDGSSPFTAFERYVMERVEARGSSFYERTEDPDYDVPGFDEPYPTADRVNGESAERPTSDAGGSGGGREGRGPAQGDPEEAAPADRGGGGRGDGPGAPQGRDAEAGGGPAVERKPPGSDGGLFDSEAQDRDLFHAQAGGSGYRPSAYEREFEAATKGKDVHEVAAYIARTAPTGAYQRIASRVAATLRRMEAQGHSFTMDVVNQGDMAPRAIDAAKGMVITRAREGGLSHNRIYLRGTDLGRVPGTQHETALHELLHAATMSSFDAAAAGRSTPRQAEAVQDLRATFNHVADEFNRAVREGKMSEFQRRYFERRNNSHASPEELLAWGLTNRDMQQELERIRMPDTEKRSAFSAFVRGVRRLLGLGEKDDTALSRVIRAADGLLDDETAPVPVPVQTRAPKVEQPSQGSFAFHLDGDGQEAKRSWGALGDLVFDPEFTGGDGAAAAAAVRRVVGDPKPAVRAVGNRLRQFGEATAYSTDSAFRSIAARLNAPTLTKLADVFHAEAGVTDRATGRTYGEAVSRGQGRFLSRLDAALEAHRGDDVAMGRIRDLLATPDKSIRASAAEREAAGTIRDLLAEVLEYRRNAGEAIGEVKDGYFPRQMRQDRVFADPDKFLRAAERAYREIGAPDPAKAAAAYLQANMDGHLGIADGVGAGGVSGSSTAKAREFGKAADTHLREFYDTNPLTALTSYLTGAVKRAEETRRFGPVGREGSAERAAWEKEHGDKSQWDVMKAAIQDEFRANGQREPGLMDRIEALRANSLGRARMGSPKIGAAVSVVHAWNQLSTLARSTAASLPEMAMGFVRAGPRLGFTHLNATLTEFVRNVRRLPPSDAARYAEAAGAIGSDNALHLLRARVDDPTANVATSKLLDQFYRKNGLEQWTRAGRTAAVKTAQRFMSVLADDMASSHARTKVRAAGYLRELGIKDPDAFAARLRADKPKLADLAGDSGHAAEYATALLRFANQTVLMPTRSVKPAWASHPLGSLVFALQSYNYAFKKQVLDRVGRETIAAVRDKDPQKLAAAAGLVVLTGTTAAVQGLRHLIWGGPVDDGKDTPLHYTLETLDRAGMFGAASPLFNAFDGLRYRRSVGQSLQGSVLGRASDAADAIGGLATDKSAGNGAERKAAGAFYDLAINPAESAIGAGVLRGAAGSALILGHGVRNENGLLPADRSRFMDAVAGPAPERGMQ